MTVVELSIGGSITLTIPTCHELTCFCKTEFARTFLRSLIFRNGRTEICPDQAHITRVRQVLRYSCISFTYDHLCQLLISAIQILSCINL